jgi:hypothetical protein
MVAYSFQPQFVPKLQAGEKSQTIRAVGRKRHARPGEMVQIYTGMRTKHCQKLFQSECLSTSAVLIFPDRTVQVDDRTLDEQEKADLAVADGFTDFDQFMEFFGQNFSHRDKAENIPFDGILVKWQYPA